MITINLTNNTFINQLLKDYRIVKITRANGTEEFYIQHFGTTFFNNTPKWRYLQSNWEFELIPHSDNATWGRFRGATKYYSLDDAANAVKHLVKTTDSPIEKTDFINLN